MKERPILYSTPMVQAKLARRKTQTRRIIKESFNGCLTNGGPHPCPNDPVVIIPGEYIDNPFEPGNGMVMDYPEVRAAFFCSTLDSVAKCPFGKVGDILWGRETFVMESIDGANWHPVYKADCPNYPLGSSHWKPSIFMPKNIARLWDRITEIRVERLQDISEEDAIAEGLIKFPHKADFAYTWKHGDNHGYGTAVGAYRSLWESINGPGSWELNPWVWVIKTEILSTTGRPENL